MNPPKEDLKEKDRNGERKKGSGGGGGQARSGTFCATAKSLGFVFIATGRFCRVFIRGSEVIIFILEESFKLQGEEQIEG